MGDTGYFAIGLRTREVHEGARFPLSYLFMVGYKVRCTGGADGASCAWGLNSFLIGILPFFPAQYCQCFSAAVSIYFHGRKDTGGEQSL